MARTWIMGFDASDYIVDGLTSGTIVYDAITPDGVGKSLKFIATSGAAGSASHTAASPQWRRARFRFTALPATTARIFVGSASFCSLRIKPDGTVEYWAGSLIGTSATALTDTVKWYTIEWLSNASGSSLVRLRIDGVDEVTTTNTTTFSGSLGPTDSVADTYTMYVDDYAADDAAFPGAGAVRLLLPISDSARALLWFAGNVGITDLWEAVNNTPPVGTVQPNAATAAITHAGGAAGSTDDYDANMTSYSTAGIPAGSTINAIRAVVATAEDIATGAKLLTFSVKSNPAQGAFETNFTVGTAAAGTYPTNWVITRGTVISAPSVVLGTSPVMTARRPETASRRADVCFMGIYVDYTPGAAGLSFPFPPKHPMLHLLVR